MTGGARAYVGSAVAPPAGVAGIESVGLYGGEQTVDRRAPCIPTLRFDLAGVAGNQLGIQLAALTLQKPFHAWLLRLLANYHGRNRSTICRTTRDHGSRGGSKFADSVELRRPASIRYRSIGVRPYAAVCDVVSLTTSEVCRNQSHAPHGRRRLAVERDLHVQTGGPLTVSGG